MEQLQISCANIYKISKHEIAKIDFALCKQPTETLESFYNRQSVKPDLLINGGFFNMQNGNTLFTYVDENKTISYTSELLYGFGINNNQLKADFYNQNYKDFISAYPILIKDGKAFSSSIGNEINYKARRTVLAYDDNYIYVIVVESPGMNFSELKQMLLQLCVTQAINLDGGGSTRLLVEGKVKTKQTYSRPVDNVVAFYLQKNLIIYRVQTGAFSNKGNAQQYQQKIQKLNDTIGAGYKNAYVRFIDGLYKVQVGAFRNKANAEKVVNDLKQKGYNSFITT